MEVYIWISGLNSWDLNILKQKVNVALLSIPNLLKKIQTIVNKKICYKNMVQYLSKSNR